jgi:hypothetical protein
MLRPRSRALAIASSAAVALVLASTFAVAEGTDLDQDGVADGLEDATQRTIVDTKIGDLFNVSSRLGTGPVRDQFEFWYWPGHFGVWYGVEGGASIRYEVEMRSLLVWKDQDADGQIAESEIRDSISLGESAFYGVGVKRYERLEDGGRVYNFVVDSRDRAVSLNITIAERFTRMAGLTLTPMEARMDVRLMPVLSDPTASVALEFRVETGRGDVVALENRSWDSEKRFAPDEHAMNVTGREGGRTASAFFSWGDDAVVSGRTVTVDTAYGELSSNRYNLSLAYPAEAPQGLVVTHQMAFGVRSLAYDSIERLAPPAPPLQPDLYLFMGTLAAVAGLVAATVFLSSHRRLRHEDEGRKP